MDALVVEIIAFTISVFSFVLGLFVILQKKPNIYFKMIICAVGCYALEELWTIVNALCGFENSFFSVRLFGIFGSFCTLLTASIHAGSIYYKNIKLNKLKKLICYFAPFILLGLFIYYVFVNINNYSLIHILISFAVLLPLMIDFYFEIRNILFLNKESFSYIRLISYIILIIYIISVLYLFVQNTNMKLALDILYAIAMAMLVFVSKRGVIYGKY